MFCHNGKVVRESWKDSKIRKRNLGRTLGKSKTMYIFHTSQTSLKAQLHFQSPKSALAWSQFWRKVNLCLLFVSLGEVLGVELTQIECSSTASNFLLRGFFRVSSSCFWCLPPEKAPPCHSRLVTAKNCRKRRSSITTEQGQKKLQKKMCSSCSSISIDSDWTLLYELGQLPILSGWWWLDGWS